MTECMVVSFSEPENLGGGESLVEQVRRGKSRVMFLENVEFAMSIKHLSRIVR